MSIKLQAGEIVNGYVIERHRDLGGYFSLYDTHKEFHPSSLFQFRSPSINSDWYQLYIDHLIELKEIISNSSLKNITEHVLDVFSTKHSSLCYVTDRLSASLDEYLELTRSIGDLIGVARELTKNVAAMHDAGLTLGAFSPSTIRVQQNGGKCKLLLSHLHWVHIRNKPCPWDTKWQFIGYSSPELQTPEGGPISTASDVFTLGVIIVELLTGKNCFINNDTSLEEALAESYVLIEKIDGLDKSSSQSILARALDPNPQNRPSAHEIIKIFPRDISESSNDIILIDKPVERSLQALAFWVAYQNGRYRHHSLPEGAIVSELTCLLSGDVKGQLTIERELMYKDLLEGKPWDTKVRADLAIMPSEPEKRGVPVALIEVKRADAPWREIEGDLIALNHFKLLSQNTLTLLVVVAQAHRPNQWVSPNGVSPNEIETIQIQEEDKTVDIRYKVRRVLKASGSFKMVDSACYCCLIEVL